MSAATSVATIHDPALRSAYRSMQAVIDDAQARERELVREVDGWSSAVATLATKGDDVAAWENAKGELEKKRAELAEARREVSAAIEKRDATQTATKIADRRFLHEQREKLDDPAAPVMTEATRSAMMLNASIAAMSLASIARDLASARGRGESRSREKFRISQALGEIPKNARWEPSAGETDRALSDVLSAVRASVMLLARENFVESSAVFRLLQAVLNAEASGREITAAELAGAALLLSQVAPDDEANASFVSK